MASKERSPEESVFQTTASSSAIEQSRLSRIAELWVVAPLRIVLEDIRMILGVGILSVFVLMGTIGIVVVPHPSRHRGERLQAPLQELAHPLGTDNIGQDLFAQVIHATPMMWEMVIAGALFTTAVATVVGTVAGYHGGRIDSILSTISDIALTIPGLPLVMILAVAIEPESPWVVGIILSANAWAGLARSIRSEVIALRTESYVEASQLLGLSTSNIIAKDILPNLMPYITVNFVTSGRNIIFGSVALYFLGLLPITDVNWGVMLQVAYDYGALYLVHARYWIIVPTVTIVLFTVALLLIAQGTERVFNPRIRARHASEDTETVTTNM